MKILVVHNQYQDPGGEDAAVQSEIRMLRRFGHDVFLYQRSNQEIDSFSPLRKIRCLFKDMIWSAEAYSQIRKLILKEKPDLVHVHNTFLVISPSVYDACLDERVPVVQTLHNFRFLCANGVFYRDGKICEDCLIKRETPAVIHRCWKNSFLLSLAVTRMLSFHQKRKTFQNKIAKYIALSNFSKEKFISAGIAKHKISVKPNFLEVDPGPREKAGDYVLYVGALRSYKGVETLLSCWTNCDKIPLRIIGAGPLATQVTKQCRQLKVAVFLGEKKPEEILKYMKGAAFVVVPSECYENFPRVVVEAFACGVPVIASNHGALKEIVRDGETGLLFQPGNPESLREKVSLLFSNKDRVEVLGQNARREYEMKYTQEKNYEQLLSIYQEAIRT